MPVELSPITEADLPRVAEFLHAEFPHEPRESAQRWERALHSPWGGETPNWGFMAQDDGTIVGVYIAHYSEQEVGGRRERFCNLGVWHVLPEYRMHSIRLLKAVIDQDEYQITDLTPADNVVALNSRLGFERLDTRGFLAPCLPWPTLPGRASITSDPARLEQVLQGGDLVLYRDHAGVKGLRHVAILDGADRCYVALREDRHGRLPVLTVLHAGEPALLRRNARRFSRHLLFRHRVLGYVAEERIVHFRPRLSASLRSPQTRMFRGDRVGADDVGYLYSELVCTPDE
jgi:hypothetical protein